MHESWSAWKLTTLALVPMSSSGSSFTAVARGLYAAVAVRGEKTREPPQKSSVRWSMITSLAVVGAGWSAAAWIVSTAHISWGVQLAASTVLLYSCACESENPLSMVRGLSASSISLDVQLTELGDPSASFLLLRAVVEDGSPLWVVGKDLACCSALDSCGDRFIWVISSLEVELGCGCCNAAGAVDSMTLQAPDTSPAAGSRHPADNSAWSGWTFPVSHWTWRSRPRNRIALTRSVSGLVQPCTTHSWGGAPKLALAVMMKNFQEIASMMHQYLSLKLLSLFDNSFEFGFQSIVLQAKDFVVTLQLFGFPARTTVLKPHSDLSRLES